MTRANTTLSTTGRANTTASRRMQNLQMPDLVPSIHLNDGTINESAFSDNVPYNSTVLYNDDAPTFTGSTMPDVSTDMENTVVLSGLIDKLVAARDAAVLQDRARFQNTGQSSTGQYSTRVPPAGSKIPRQGATSQPSAKMARKMRRSNSCSEIVLASRKQGVQRPRLGSKPEGQENLPSIRCVGLF